MQKMIPQKSFLVFARVRIQAPHVFAEKLIPQDFFPACIGFVPGGNSLYFVLFVFLAWRGPVGTFVTPT